MKRIFIGALLLVAACTEERSPECKDVCEREARCAESSDSYRFDQNECVSACSALWRDKDGNQFVKHHIDCMNKARTCDEVYACTFRQKDAGPR